MGSTRKDGRGAIPDGSIPHHPDTITKRYARLATRLGIHTTLKIHRHYNATELINAGYDVRAAAGRLGHSGGGATTLRVYTASDREQQLLELRRQLEERNDELAAARAANRELMTQLNAPLPQH
jgi:anaerobic selenocysteine-containing dehydrogenase